ncbi:hypothetical protein [Corynebacterium parakroppenstedtii]|uniref:hypothetical protein n=1 Tax=Corynebacterium parakroppenstedtii TaxID=2828363 RepID=UPI001C8F5B57|nr:hypothetical protein [Corynebacterium parakroppenstedtii]MBY0794031.1 hypothetical protein [Corynebacterium parakroppenstedtii]
MVRKTRRSGERNNSHIKCAFTADAGLALISPTLTPLVTADARPSVVVVDPQAHMKKPADHLPSKWFSRRYVENLCARGRKKPDKHFRQR